MSVLRVTGSICLEERDYCSKGKGLFALMNTWPITLAQVHEQLNVMVNLHVRGHPHVPGNISSVLCYYWYLAENITQSVYYNQCVNIHNVDKNVGTNTKIKAIGYLEPSY